MATHRIPADEIGRHRPWDGCPCQPARAGDAPTVEYTHHRMSVGETGATSDAAAHHQPAVAAT